MANIGCALLRACKEDACSYNAGAYSCFQVFLEKQESPAPTQELPALDDHTSRNERFSPPPRLVFTFDAARL